ncbi:MAG: hypothetical protein AAGE37_02935 [Pseudomonadota bacterium]
MFYMKSFIAASAVALTVFVSTAGSADARPRVASQNFERGNGSSDYGVRFDTRRGQASKTVTRNANRDARNAKASASWTGANGRTATYNRSVQGHENGYSANASYSDFQGRTATRSQSAIYGNESITRSYGATFRNGGSVNGSASATRTDNGYERSKSLGTSSGRGGSYDETGTRYEDGGGNVTKGWTNVAGETVASKSSTYQNGTKTTVYSNRDGNTRTVVLGERD